MRFITLTLVCLLFFQYSWSQKRFRFGKIPMKDMQMTTYEPDPSAPAVILFSTGHFQVRDYTFTKRMRIKVLKPAGAEYGNFSIQAPGKGYIKAACYNLENGKIEEYKIKNSDIYEEQVRDDIFIYKFFVPNVKVGSVIEVELRHDWLPIEYNFQQMIPTRYNELVVEESQYFFFDASVYGDMKNISRVGSYHWVGKDIPAFTPEPMVDYYGNYISKVAFEMTEVAIPGVFYKEYCTSWDEVSETLLEDQQFGLAINSGMGYLNSKAKEIEQMEGTKIEKVLAAYAYIKENIEWNGANYIYVSSGYRSNFNKHHTGNAGEINLNLISLLQKCGFDANPVVFSTRDNGYIKKYKPTLNKLNYVVCHVKLDDQEILLDASAKNVMPGVLPEKCLNGDGWLVHETQSRWVPLEPSIITTENSFIQLDLSETNGASAIIKRNLNLYDYYLWKEKYDEYESTEKYAQSLQDKYDEIYVENYNVKIDEDHMKVTETIQFDVSNNVEEIGNEIIINPFILAASLENPFKTEERSTPVHLGHATNQIRTIVIKLPENLQISKTPEPLKLASDDGETQFVFFTQVQGSQMIIKYQLVITNPVVPTNNYPIFKTIYSLMIDKLNESVTLQKT